jgi:hypothetical protein
MPAWARTGSHVMPAKVCALVGIYGCGMLVLFLLSVGVHTTSLHNGCRPFGAVFGSRKRENQKQ